MTWIATIITLLIGYTLGRYSSDPEPIDDLVKRTKFPLRKFKKDRKLGAIKKLPPTEMARKGTRLEEEDLEMDRVLKDVL